MIDEIKGDLIDDFFEAEDGGQREGAYFYQSHYEPYLSDIDHKYFYYRILRRPEGYNPGVILIKHTDVEMGEVFSPQRTSHFTYVDRRLGGQQTYEASLIIASKTPGNSIVLHGNSKLGKTALWESVLGYKSLRVHCGCRVSIDTLYKTIVDEINAPYLDSKEISKTGGTSGEIGVGLEINAGFIKGNLGEKDGRTQITQDTMTYKYHEKNINAQSISKIVSNEDRVVVFENYHRLTYDVFRDLCIDLRTFADHGVTTIFVGIPANPAEMTIINPELIGRVQFLMFKPWKKGELKEIAINGAEALNVNFSNECLEFLSTESAGSPLLMQLYCYCTCLSSGIFGCSKSHYPESVDFDEKRFAMIVREYGKQYLEPYRYIIDNIFQCLDCDSRSFFEALIALVKTQGADIQYSIKDITNGYDPYDVIEKIQNVMPNHDFFSADRTRDMLLINDPLLISYMRWIH